MLCLLNLTLSYLPSCVKYSLFLDIYAWWGNHLYTISLCLFCCLHRLLMHSAGSVHMCIIVFTVFIDTFFWAITCLIGIDVRKELTPNCL